MSRIFSFRIKRITFLRVSGAIFDATLAQEFLAILATFEGDWPPIIVDLSTIDYIDTSGLSALCQLARNEGARPVYLAGVTGRLARGLARVPKAQLPPCYERLADAIHQCEYAEVAEADVTAPDEVQEWMPTREQDA